MLATIHWEYLALLVVIVIAALVVSPIALTFFRGARAIADTESDEFRLSSIHMWTEVHRAHDGGSFQTMRLNDGNFVWVSVGLTTLKVFVTPSMTDAAQFKELRTFELLNGAMRFSLPPERRDAEDLLLLERLRRAIAWPASAEQLGATLTAMDNSLLEMHDHKGGFKEP